jgi:hypothetical protein
MHTSPNTSTSKPGVIRGRRMRKGGYVPLTGVKRNPYTILLGESERNKLL